MVFIHKGQGQI